MIFQRLPKRIESEGVRQNNDLFSEDTFRCQRDGRQGAGRQGCGRACLFTGLTPDHAVHRHWSAPAAVGRASTAASLVAYPPCRAASACCASSCRTAKNSGDWPMNSPSAVKALAAPIAAPCVSVGRMIETTGNLRLRKIVGSGMIRLVWKSSPPKGGALRSGNTRLLVGSVRAGALPALSCQV